MNFNFVKLLFYGKWSIGFDKWQEFFPIYFFHTYYDGWMMVFKFFYFWIEIDSY